MDILLAGLAAIHLVALPIFLIALADNEQRTSRLRFGTAFLVAALATAAIAKFPTVITGLVPVIHGMSMQVSMPHGLPGQARH